ncbi:MAG: DUF5596 domain-containing protein [Oscillospiraceae bacterium]|nr:DUF5596 domain-containing protein [Oscillospiraceae bacterium]
MSKMSPLQLGQKLNLPAVSIEALKNFKVSEETAARLKAAFQSSQEEFEAEARKEPEADLLVLALYLRWSMDAHFLYAIRGMSWDIFFDTFRDLTIWANAFTEETGRPGLKEWGWCGRAIRMQLFRLGRLQFQEESLASDIVLGDETFPAGTKVLQVHIPAGEPLTPEAVEESLGRAQSFFRTYYRQKYELFCCRSWLLSPALEELLGEDSNILQFKKRFELYGTLPERQAEERVFGKLQADPACYPEDTSLQRSMKQYLMAGKQVDMGCGIIRCRNVEEVYS